MMVGNAVLWFLVLVAACHGSIIPRLPPPADERGGHLGNGAGGGPGPLRKPGYVRMPVSRHKLNGTDAGPGGRHSPSPPPPHQHTTPADQQRHFARPRTATNPSPVRRDLSALDTQPLVPRQGTNSRRWGWSSLEELGGIAYIIQLEIGTPPQRIKVFVDTGSYELWVNPRCDTSASESICQSHGNYYPDESSSSMYVGGKFAVTYGTGAVRGSYWSDKMSVAMLEIPQVQFAVADDSNYTFSGILGLGYSYPYSINYPSVLTLMVSQDMISAPIFGLGLGGDQDNFSEIIFGGVNRWKFAGPLEAVHIWPPISQQDPRWIQYWVNVTSVGMTKPGEQAVIYTNRDTFTMPTLLDTGSTLSYIREDLVAQIGQQFHATIDSGGNYIVDCAWRDEPGTVDFGFNRGRMVINVRYKDFIYQQYPGHCMLGVQPADAGSTHYVLGDTFIRGAYLVFDQQSDIVWMNQYYNCGDGVVTVGEIKGDTGSIIFIPTFPPVTTGNPACSVLSSPRPFSSRFTQNTAFPSTGRNVSPFSHGSSQSTIPSAHHLSSAGASKRGKLVPPPNELARLPPTAAAACAAEGNQSVWKCGSRCARGTSWPWKASARDSMQDTTASVGGRVVDCEVRRAVLASELEVMPLRVKVDLLGEVPVVSGEQGG
ncbi:aspartic peptidase domain-containing protein [Chaetomium sp. MPI-CAGE-AT-0009]|nr:aspartic peptidase domain-containing protein [Chaetomium sp. MPI-CAGE-AT-0009]